MYRGLLFLLSFLTVCPALFAQPPAEGTKSLREKLNKSSKEIAGLKRMTWKVGDTTREALVHVPASTVSKPALIFAFHGHGGTAEFSARKFKFHEIWPDAITVYPQGLPTAAPFIDPEGKRAGWQKAIGDQKDRDLEFYDAMLKSLQKDYGIDEKKVFVTGHSNGGFFTYVLWAARNDTLAAVAPIAALLDLKDFKGMKPKPCLHVAGEKDPLVRYQQQIRTIEEIRKLNGCDSTGKPAGTHCTEYPSSTGTEVITFLHSGGHEIPDGAVQRIQEFFQAVAKR
jgi:polyhydroxybutyrate depolymerase